VLELQKAYYRARAGEYDHTGPFEEAFRFARNHALTNTYVSLYVVLAEMLDIDMWTDDQPLLKALGATTPRVRAIGNYPMPSSA
jgi:predicted nucleic acid-binding protein